MASARARLGVLALAGGAAYSAFACTVSASLEGKSCPCVAGFVCVGDTCVVERPSVSGSDGGAASTLLTIANLRAGWTTANAIYWQWDATGQKDDFARYELTVASSEQELDLGQGTRFDASTNPELGHFVLPRTGSPDDFVRSTLTGGLTENAGYAARLVAVDRLGARATSNLALASTTVARDSVTWYDDAPPSWTVPPCVTSVSQGSYSGASHLEYRVSCDPDAGDNECGPSGLPACWTAVHFGATPDLRAIQAGTFADAFLEFALSIDRGSDAWWGAVIVSAGTSVYTIQPLTLRATGDYHVYQVKLSALKDDKGQALPLGALATLDTFSVGGEITSGSLIRLDAVRVRY